MRSVFESYSRRKKYTIDVIGLKTQEVLRLDIKQDKHYVDIFNYITEKYIPVIHKRIESQDPSETYGESPDLDLTINGRITHTVDGNGNTFSLFITKEEALCYNGINTSFLPRLVSSMKLFYSKLSNKPMTDFLKQVETLGRRFGYEEANEYYTDYDKLFRTFYLDTVYQEPLSCQDYDNDPWGDIGYGGNELEDGYLSEKFEHGF